MINAEGGNESSVTIESEEGQALNTTEDQKEDVRVYSILSIYQRPHHDSRRVYLILDFFHQSYFRDR